MSDPRLPLHRHQAIGRELNAISDRLLTLSVEIGNAYPMSSVVGRMAARMADGVDTIRAELSHAVHQEHPLDATGDTYYPSRNREEVTR